jgi:outer membrane protein assembly factor BamB
MIASAPKIHQRNRPMRFFVPSRMSFLKIFPGAWLRALLVLLVAGGNADLFGAADGSLRWSFVTGLATSVTSSPAIGPDGTIYVGVKVTTTFGDGRVFAINPNGSMKWNFETPTDWVESSPAVAADGTVYVGSWDGNLYAINGTTGAQKWKFSTGAFYIYSSPAIGPDGTVYVGSGDFTLHAIAPDTGVERWQVPTASWVDSSPAIGADGSVYFGSWDNSIYGIRSDGTIKWQVTTGAPVVSSPAIGADGTVYCGSTDGQLYAIGQDGTQQWAYLTGNAINSSPVLGADGTILFGSNDGYFYALNSDGTLKWKATIGRPIASTAAVRADGSIIFGADDNKVHALNPDGTPLWTFVPPSWIGNDSFESSPVVAADGTIYVGSIDGRLYALNGNGSPLASASPWPMFHRTTAHAGLEPAVAPAITAQPVSQTVTAGTNVTLTAAASGAPAPTYQWKKGGTDIAGATSATLPFNSVTTNDAATYTVVATNSAGSVTSNAAVLTVNALDTSGSYLANLSVRVAMAAGQTLIVGFVVDGGAKPVLVRAAGPVLNQYGLTGVVDPQLKLFNGSSVQVAANDNWDVALAPTFTTLGAFPFDTGSKDAALQQTINGPHSAQATATGPGALLVEAYDAGPNDGRKLVNLSTRFQVGTGDNILITGFVVSGTGPKQVLVRAVGPKLTDYGVTGVLADPQLAVFDGGTVIASNDNWSSTLSATFTALGAFALNPVSKDAALVVTLQAGKAYSVQVSGVGNTTGEALAEIYVLP